MAVLLVSPPSFSAAERFYIPCNEIPLNLCYLAAYLEHAGIKTDIIDLDVEPSDASFTEYLEVTRPSVIGFTSFSPFIERAAALAAKVKAWNKDALTVIGGYHASAFPERTLQEFPSFDMLVFGEGEQTFLDIVRHFEEERKIPSGITGTSVRAESGIARNEPREQFEDINSLPFPARDKLKLDRYKPNPVNYLKLPSTALLASRGCHFACTFCSKFLFKGERTRSAENIFGEIEECGNKFGIKDFRFYDDNFTWHRETCLKTCEMLRRRAPDVSWNCFSRVDCIDEELLRAMKAAGCYQVKYGVETGSEKTLKLINKRITFDQSRNAIALSKKVGVECQISMMIGLPGESSEDIDQTIRFSKELSPDLILFNVFKPIPGSMLYNRLENEGRLLKCRWEDFLVKSTVKVMKDSPDEETLALYMKKAYTEFYFRPAYFLQRMKWLLKAPAREIRRYIAAAGIFSRSVLQVKRK